jgi:outer membrane protein TolC
MRSAAFLAVPAAVLIFSVFSFAQNPLSTRQSDNNRVFATRLNRIVDQVIAANPQIKAAHLQSLAARASAASVRSLEPPLAAVEFFQAPIRYFPNPLGHQMEIDYSLQQMFPFPGKRSTMSRAEHERAEMLDAQRRTAEQDAIQRAREAFFELYLDYRRLEVNTESQTTLSDVVAIARKQYELGTGKQADILRSQTELSSVKTQEIVLRQDIASREAMINALRNRPILDSVGFIPEIEPQPVSLTYALLDSAAMQHRPELSSMLAGIRMQQAEASVAHREYFPDFMVRGTYKQMLDTTDDWAIMVGLTLPIAPWSIKGRFHQTEQQNYLLEEAQERYNGMRAMIAAEVRDALARVNSSEQQMDLQKRTVIPQARQTLQSAQSAYQTGGTDFLMLLDSQRSLYEAEDAYHMAVANYLQSRAQLERAIGISLDDVQTANNGTGQ